MYMEISDKITMWDIIGVIADIQTSFTEHYKTLELKYDWSLSEDARLQIVFNCCDLAANSRLSIAILGFTKTNGMLTQEWWEKWAGYNKGSLLNIPDFKLYVDDKGRQYIHRIREQLLVTTQIYIESFIRNLAREFEIDENLFRELKRKFLIEILNLSEEELTPITVFQHLKNSLHNKGIHYDKKYSEDKNYEINGYSFNFKHTSPIIISWQHIRELLIANSNLIFKIIENPKVSELKSFTDKNVTILDDE